jgi:hypothetical protein
MTWTHSRNPHAAIHFEVYRNPPPSPLTIISIRTQLLDENNYRFTLWYNHVETCCDHLVAEGFDEHVFDATKIIS